MITLGELTRILEAERKIDELIGHCSNIVELADRIRKFRDIEYIELFEAQRMLRDNCYRLRKIEVEMKNEGG